MDDTVAPSAHHRDAGGSSLHFPAPPALSLVLPENKDMGEVSVLRESPVGSSSEEHVRA